MPAHFPPGRRATVLRRRRPGDPCMSLPIGLDIAWHEPAHVARGRALARSLLRLDRIIERRLAGGPPGPNQRGRPEPIEAGVRHSVAQPFVPVRADAAVMRPRSPACPES